LTITNRETKDLTKNETVLDASIDPKRLAADSITGESPYAVSDESKLLEEVRTCPDIGSSTCGEEHPGHIHQASTMLPLR
jgi:hypothetical protein